MLDLARRNQAEAGVNNVHWLRGHIEDIPLPRDSVDVVISNCVINLSTDKPQVLREAARVLNPGGRFAVSDVVADPDMDDATRADMRAYTGCIAGALTRRRVHRRAQGRRSDRHHRSPRPTAYTSAAVRRSSAPPSPADSGRSAGVTQASHGGRPDPRPADP